MENFVLGQAWAWPLLEGRWQRTILTRKDGELTPLQHSWVQAAVTVQVSPCPPISLALPLASV